MADETKAPDAPKPPIRVGRAKDFRVVYTNTFRVRLSSADLSITFGYQTEIPTPTGDQALIQDEVEVVFNPLSLKLFQMAMVDAVEGLEKSIGPINIPQEILDAVAAAKLKVAEGVPKT
jgi:hypothetical protein